MDWIESYNVHELDIDIRRFTSFGVIKVCSATVPWSWILKPFPGVPTAGSPLANFTSHGYAVTNLQEKVSLHIEHECFYFSCGNLSI
jgi:hypothetical protein